MMDVLIRRFRVRVMGVGESPVGIKLIVVDIKDIRVSEMKRILDGKKRVREEGR